MKKMAVIELDTKYANLIWVNANDTGLFVISDKITESIALDGDPEQNGNVKPIRIDEAIKLIQYYKRIISTRNIDTVLCYCTQRFILIKNHKAILDEIFRLTGYEFQLYTDTYANLIHLCSYNTVEPLKGIAIDIEPNNINFVRYNRRSIMEVETYDFGAESLAKLVENDPLTPSQKMDKMIAFCREQFEGCTFFDGGDEEYKIVGMGNAFTNISKICRLGTKYSFARDHGYELNEDNFNNALKIIKDLDADKTKKIKGISSDRADIVASGTAIIKALITSFYLTSIRVCATSLYEGVLYEYMAKNFGEKNYPDILTTSLETSNYFYDGNGEEVKRLFSVANDLFEELRVLHRYTKHHHKILKIASYFALSGKRIDFNNFEKNCLFIAQNSNIYGASHLEILVAGFVAGCQNTEDFDINKWVVHRDIITPNEEYLDVVKKLAVLVKIARIIVKICPAKHAVCDVLGDNCILSVTSEDGETYRTSEIKSAISDFKKAYNKILQVL